MASDETPTARVVNRVRSADAARQRTSGQERETPNRPRVDQPHMDRQQILAILFVLLMVGSSIAYGVASFL